MRPNDRIRRILSDGAPPPGRRGKPVLRQVEGATDAPTEDPVDADALTPLRERLRILERLSRRAGPLRVDVPARIPPENGGGRAPPAEGTLVHPPQQVPDSLTNEELPLEALVGGTLRETVAGACWQVDLRYDLQATHGTVLLADALHHPVRLRPNERGPEDRDVLDLRRAVFLDTETTGLAGGTGTVAFLVGAGWLDDSVFHVRQYFMRDYPEEAGLLQAVRDDLDDRPLVSFNGRSYDWPLLLTRWKLSRTRWDANTKGAAPSPWTPGGRAHFDLLPIARRLWSRTLHSRSLGTIERHVLGLGRQDDLPSASIPAAYFHYLRSGYSHAIARAFRHNQVDIVSMLALLAPIGRIVAEPEVQVAHPGDALGTARLLLDLGESSLARRCLEARLPDAAKREQPEMRRMLATLCRRAGDVQAALVQWTALATNPHVFDREAYEHVAKVYEHQLRDFDTALRWTEEALERVPQQTAAWAALEHRRDRLERRRKR